MKDIRVLNITELTEFEIHILETNMLFLFNGETISYQSNDFTFDMWLKAEKYEGIIQIYIQEVDYNGYVD